MTFPSYCYKLALACTTFSLLPIQTFGITCISNSDKPPKPVGLPRRHLPTCILSSAVQFSDKTSVIIQVHCINRTFFLFLRVYYHLSNLENQLWCLRYCVIIYVRECVPVCAYECNSALSPYSCDTCRHWAPSLQKRTLPLFSRCPLTS